jgi:AcrR family transcriptional regulator
MTTAPTTRRKLSTADERRETLLATAMPVFAERGYDAAPTLEIANKAGISHAYLFRLFPTKVELFVAVCDLSRERMLSTFREAAARARVEGLDPLGEMGRAYGELLVRDRDVLLIQLHSQVAARREKRIRDAMRRTFRDLYELVRRESDAGPEELKMWFADGMLYNVMAAIDADRLAAEWAKALTADGPASD